MNKVALVTGSSSGIGHEISLALAREGYHTYATMRNVSKAEQIQNVAKKEKLNITTLQLDVDNDKSVNNAIDKIISESDRIDVLVNNAGFGIVGLAEDVRLDEFKKQFETNLFGTVRLIQRVTPIMRRQQNGFIINISSVAGRIGFPGMSAYISSKFALEGLSESLRYELGQFGIKVIIIEPGMIKTNFFNTMKILRTKHDDDNSKYDTLMDKVITGIKTMAEFGTPPSQVADAVIKAINDNEKSLPRYMVGNDAQMFLEAKKTKTDIEFEEYLKKELFSS
jgi:NAD(P)-dependent dehydrogenase (short-subunit alcohol dehydrogenase family)